MLAPEYGGDGGKKVGECEKAEPPIAAFPAHWAPNDLKIYKGSQFPEGYRGRRLHRLPRLVEPRAGPAGRLQRRVPAAGGWQARPATTSSSPTDSRAPQKEPGARRAPAVGLRRRTRRRALRQRRQGRPHLARDL